MHNIYEIKQIHAIIVCLLVAVCASFARVLLYKTDNFTTTVKTFFGGIFIGTLIGFLFSRSEKFSSYDVIGAATAGLIGREFVTFIVVEAPAMLKTGWEKLKNLKSSK